ncbi:cilia- and flagella-associated protein 52 isoform X2 [Cimex lectularius]|nr:cilia- and flagella-associated protein 52 isoform X2 [Cimex lectularius]XP_024084288.1 cilia- and flagella-associated protein 52 isoform X2 [Cimex lectularius]
MKGLNVHPDGEHLIYPFGVKVAIHSLATKTNRYLEGPNNVITSIAVSKSGKFVAAGQVNHMGFRAPVFVWNFDSGTIKMSHESHKVRVENVAFSVCERYIISLGGKDDANVVVFDIETLDAVCGVFSSNQNAGDALTIGVSNTRNLCFMTGGVYTLKLWTLCPGKRTVSGLPVQMGKIRRKVTTIKLTPDDEFAYCGTSTGDIMKIKTNFSKTDPENFYPVAPPVLLGCYAKHPKVKRKLLDIDLWVLGVRTLLILDANRLVVGSGDGKVELVKTKEEKIDRHLIKGGGLSTPTFPLFAVEKSCFAGTFVTSLEMLKKDETIIVGNMKCEILIIDLKTFKCRLYLTCHIEAVYDIAFPNVYADVFATASKNDVRLWSVQDGKELLRISVPNFTCSSLLFTHDGRSIVTGWNDGTVRAFTPQSGKPIYIIRDAHSKGVSAIAMTKDGKKLVTGGVEGQVRIWCVRKDVQKLLAVLKEHKGPVSSVAVAPNDKEAASSSTDGSCIIWDIVKNVRLAIMFSTTLFLCIKYHPSGCQLITSGTNRLIGYWETFDGSLIREVEGSRSAALNTLAISKDGRYMVSGGNDYFVKVWLYREGIPTHVGLGHGAVITAVAISPDQKTVVSASADGALFIWRAPMDPPNLAGLADEANLNQSTNEEANITNEENDDKVSTISKSDESEKLLRKSSGTSQQSFRDQEPTEEEKKRSQSDLDKAIKEREVKAKKGKIVQNGNILGGVKCYCKKQCTCDNQNMPRSPKSEFEEARDESIRNLA